MSELQEVGGEITAYEFRPSEGVVSLHFKTETGRQIDVLFPCADTHKYALFARDVEEFSHWRIAYYPSTNRIRSMRSAQGFTDICVIQ
jgi:hypothetical protein